jgi:hypothetical protein
MMIRDAVLRRATVLVKAERSTIVLAAPSV